MNARNCTPVRLGDEIVDGVFIERPNRYLARVQIGGQETEAHVPDPGRLPGLMIPGRRVRLVHCPGPKRKTDYSLVLVRQGSIWVSVYPGFANVLVERALAEGSLPFFAPVTGYASEVKMGSSRLDFRIDTPSALVYVEVKSVSFVEDGVGRFPDAPTTRGVKHLRELMSLLSPGRRAAVLFVSQRSDTRVIRPNDGVDPEFGRTLREAKRAGVELYGINCTVGKDNVALHQPVEVVAEAE